jgi:hypothetical protein
MVKTGRALTVVPINSPGEMKMAKPDSYEVVVGNVGSVYNGYDGDQAKADYNDYVEISKHNRGSRAYGEDVTLFVHSETASDIEMEHAGHLKDGEGNYILGE